MRTKAYLTFVALCSTGLFCAASSANAAEAPYGGTPAAIPGTVQAENYDTGGQGTAYNVTTVYGTGNSYRSDGVDLEATTDTGGGYDIGWTAAGQWFKYTVNVATAGTYKVTFRLAALTAVTDGFHISNAAGTNLSGSINVPATGGWQVWENVTATVTLPAGQQTLTINQDNAGWNINSVAFASSGGGGTGGPYGGTPAPIPGTVLAENYDLGGPGVGYNVTSVNGSDNAYRSDGVDLEVASAPATGNDIGWTAAGQWFKYTVNAATAGTYAVTIEVASESAIPDAFHLSNLSGTNLSGSVAVPDTGGWQTWTTVTASVTLPAGVQTLTLNQDAGGWNIDSLVFASTGGGGGTDILDISAGATAASGSYVADEYYAGGAASATASTISTTGVTSPAPEAVYQHQRFGNFTYTLPGFTAGTTYPVRLHFDEFYWTAAGKRVFNVLINGTQVLTNFDIFASAGGEDIAIVKQFNAVANSAGQIVIQFVTVTDNAEINGIEVESGSGGTNPVAPQPPTGLTANPVSSSEIDLSWTASPTAGVEYNVIQDGTQIATVTGTTYANTGLTASTTYTYEVEATDSGGTSTPDGPVSAETQASGGGGSGSCAGVANITVGGVTYVPQWCQEFNNTTAGPPDTTVWGFDLGGGGWGNGEAEVYCGPPGYAGNPSQCPTTFSTATAPVYVDGKGHLVIQPINENGAWLSGRLQTYNGQQFGYGILVASMELPNDSNQGLWPAFWTLGSNLKTGVAWPTCGESDIMENWAPAVYGGPGTGGNCSTLHTQDTGGDGVGKCYTFPAGQATNTAFHTYGMIRSANEEQFYIDNPAAPYFTATPSVLPSGDVWAFNQTEFTILNVAVGGTLGGSDSGLASPTTPLIVDYVRFYAPQ